MQQPIRLILLLPPSCRGQNSLKVYETCPASRFESYNLGVNCLTPEYKLLSTVFDCFSPVLLCVCAYFYVFWGFFLFFCIYCCITSNLTMSWLKTAALILFIHPHLGRALTTWCRWDGSKPRPNHPKTRVSGDGHWLSAGTLDEVVGPNTSCGLSAWPELPPNMAPGSKREHPGRQSQGKAVPPSLTQRWKKDSITFITSSSLEARY